MARRVKWTEQALADLSAVADYIALDSPHYAAAFVREVRNAARSLTIFAERGRIVPEFANRNNSNILPFDKLMVRDLARLPVLFVERSHRMGSNTLFSTARLDHDQAFGGIMSLLFRGAP